MSENNCKSSIDPKASQQKQNKLQDFSTHRISRSKKAAIFSADRRTSNLTRRRPGSAGKWVAVGAFILILLIGLKLNFSPESDLYLEPNPAVDSSLTEYKQTKSAQSGMTLKPEHFAKSLLFAAGQNDFPSRVDVEIQGYAFPLTLEYTLDEGLQNALSDWLDRYDPDFAVAVALNPDNGRILALTTHVSDGEPLGNLAMSSSFPAASVFKIITAAAAMDLEKLSPASVIPFNGKSTNLYKKQVLNHRNNKWTRKPTLKEAFAKSINPVFGRIGLYTVGGQQLKDYAGRFYFDTQIKTDVTIDPSLSYIPLDNDWAIVEAASGYTNKVTLSPLHGAAVAASIINGGQVMRPFLVERAYDSEARLVYKGQHALLSTAISTKTANQMQVLMEQTVKIGTARKSFRKFFKGDYTNLKVGGKTGSLTGRGENLNGQNDWFVGYAYNGQRKLAFAVLNVNREKWKVKSHYLAQLMIEYYFDASLDIDMTASTQ